MILCDIDGVLATGPVGDTAVGLPIYRTFRSSPAALEQIHADNIPFLVITAKERVHARQILDAVGLDHWPDRLVTANDLFWGSVWRALRRGRLPGGLSKGVSAPLLPALPAGRTVMIENQANHLHDMVAAGVIDLGILVPPIRIADGVVAQLFDLDLALRLARDFVQGVLTPAQLEELDVRVERWEGEAGFSEVAAERLDPSLGEGQHLLRLPTVPNIVAESRPTIDDLDTGAALERGSLTVVGVVRSARRLARNLTSRIN